MQTHVVFMVLKQWDRKYSINPGTRGSSSTRDRYLSNCNNDIFSLHVKKDSKLQISTLVSNLHTNILSLLSILQGIISKFQMTSIRDLGKKEIMVTNVLPQGIHFMKINHETSQESSNIWGPANQNLMFYHSKKQQELIILPTDG